MGHPRYVEEETTKEAWGGFAQQGQDELINGQFPK
jgi:hypothetical protein